MFSLVVVTVPEIHRTGLRKERLISSIVFKVYLRN